ncbi:MAG TPA: hypothetical protein VF456_26905 [Vicinamibacterales bacterium]
MIHGSVVALLVFESTAKPMFASRHPDGEAPRRSKLTVFVVPPAPNSRPGLRPTEETDDGTSEKISGHPVLSIPGLTLNVRKVAARANLLFPVITPGLALEQFLPADFSDRPSLVNPFSGSANADRAIRAPLSADAQARQALVDRSWSRHERWHAFQALAPVIAQYNGNDGDLPRVLQMYFEQNGLQPFVDAGTPDQRVWAQLAVAADHIDFIGFISQYMTGRQASKTTTGLLFVLDTVIQSNLDVILTVLALDPGQDLTLTRRTNQAAFDLIVQVQQRCRTELTKRRLTSAAAVATYYDAVRLAILDTIVRTSPDGYRTGDARYLMGAIYWRQGNVDAAVNQWRSIKSNEADTFKFVYSPILAALGNGSTRMAMIAAVDRALSVERSQWRSSSYDRLKKFGYHFDTF